jgi:hypothetical protein
MEGWPVGKDDWYAMDFDGFCDGWVDGWVEG